MKTPQQLNLPKKFRAWRPGQGELVERVAESSDRVFLLDAPTGTGKSLVGIAVHQSRVLSKVGKEVLARLSGKTEREFEHKCLFVTRTKQLQDQICHEFPAARTMKGRNNYPCLKHKKDFPEITAEDCTSTEENRCEQRPECPYFRDKDLARRAPLVVLNTSYFLTEANGPGMFSGVDLLIIDEVDALENELMNYIQLRVTTRQLGRLGLELPKDPHTLQGWLSWASALTLFHRTAGMQMELDQVPESEWTDIEIEKNRLANRLRNFQLKLNSFLTEVNDSWIFFEEESKGETVWTFKPVKVDLYAEYYLWRHAKRFLGMSGTILSPEILAEDLGIDDWDYASSVCPFPLVNRPIYYQPAVNLTNKTLIAEIPRLAEAVISIMKKYPDDKILVHTTSFTIRDKLLQLIPGDRTMTHDSYNRHTALEEFKSSWNSRKVMFSPSFDRGVDLPDDLCRCIIICKVPYISLGDPQVKARMKMPGGERWYLLKAVQTIVQMSGRGVRSDIDHCDTYILDRQFGSLLSRMEHYFPQWWRDAIIREGR